MLCHLLSSWFAKEANVANDNNDRADEKRGTLEVLQAGK